MLGSPGYENFKEACSEINLDISKISYFTQIDDWESGKRYSFYYDDVNGVILYMLEGISILLGLMIRSTLIQEDIFICASVYSDWDL